MDDEKYGCLHEMFIEQARKTPDAAAVVSDDGRSLTFKELDEITDVLALHFRHRGCGKDQVVGLYIEKCLEYPVVYIAALKAGGAYLPLELSYPELLLASILKDAKPVTVVTTEDFRGRIPSSIPVTVLNKDWMKKIKQENEALGILPSLKSSLDDLAYVVYSSGTTGQPKDLTVMPFQDDVSSTSTLGNEWKC
ncbi:hypothetical protein QZH41_003937 [Actinostola sp. cb2023]|nr:hypothetical protein QZH41_003937 [Actinostola sp. cb2023]